MKSRWISAFALLACAGSSISAVSSNKATGTNLFSKITGDYVEARTAAVFAGPCHFNGELVTVGRDAIMAWKIASGSFNGVDLAGVRAMAVVNSKSNLGDDTAARQSALLVDSAATNAQVTAFVAMLNSRRACCIGQIASIRRGPVSFSDSANAYEVSSPGFGDMSVQPMPNNECCAQPNLVWYSPLTTLTNRKVGFTTDATYSAGGFTDPWNLSGENTAFYGQFSF